MQLFGFLPDENEINMLWWSDPEHKPSLFRLWNAWYSTRPIRYPLYRELYSFDVALAYHLSVVPGTGDWMHIFQEDGDLALIFLPKMHFLKVPNKSGIPEFRSQVFWPWDGWSTVCARRVVSWSIGGPFQGFCYDRSVYVPCSPQSAFGKNLGTRSGLLNDNLTCFRAPIACNCL